jgi:hypothetical protein
MTDQQKKRELIKTYLLVLLNEAKAQRAAREEQLLLNFDPAGKKPN